MKIEDLVPLKKEQEQEQVVEEVQERKKVLQHRLLL